jgi:hypothetical protein
MRFHRKRQVTGSYLEKADAFGGYGTEQKIRLVVDPNSQVLAVVTFDGVRNYPCLYRMVGAVVGVSAEKIHDA